MSPQEIGNLFATVGIPGAIALAMLYGGYRGAGWAAEKVLIPVVCEVIELIRSLKKSVESITTTMDGIQESQQQALDALRAAQCRYPKSTNP